MADKMADMADSRVGDVASRERKRRQYGTGSIYKRTDGRWAGAIDAGYTERGTRRRITRTGKTEAEVKTKLKELARQIGSEGVPAASSRTTVKTWAEAWLEITRRDLRPRSWNADRAAIRNYIVPTIGHKRLEQLTPADFRAVGEAVRQAGKSTSTGHRYQITLRTMLAAARQEGHNVPARVLEAKPMKTSTSDRTAMTIPEALAMLHVASFLPHGSRWAMAFLHGMRQGECLGLTWDTVNLDAGMVIVEWQLQPLPYLDRHNKAAGFRVPDGYEVRQLSGAHHLVRPKTKSGFRVIPLIPGMLEAMRDWREVAPASPYGLVWPTAEGGPANDKHDRDEWRAIQGSAGVGHPNGRYYDLHEARHATATRMLEEGVDPRQITALMGHSSIVSTHGYQHPGTQSALAALEAVGARYQLG